MKLNIAVLPGDGIGPEIVNEALNLFLPCRKSVSNPNYLLPS